MNIVILLMCVPACSSSVTNWCEAGNGCWFPVKPSPVQKPLPCVGVAGSCASALLTSSAALESSCCVGMRWGCAAEEGLRTENRLFPARVFLSRRWWGGEGQRRGSLRCSSRSVRCEGCVVAMRGLRSCRSWFTACFQRWELQRGLPDPAAVRPGDHLAPSEPNRTSSCVFV